MMNESIERLRRTVQKHEQGGTTPPSETELAMLGIVSGGVKKIPLDLIDPWRDSEDASPQPFHLYPEEKLRELADNLKENGLLEPVILRPSPRASDRYQTLAGHNRIAAAKLAGWTSIDAFIRDDLTDDEAKIVMVDSNLQHRDRLLPSEKAWAYRIRLDSLKHQGKATSSQLGTKLRSDSQLADSVGESRMQIQRYIRLTYLLPELLNMVDEDAIPVAAGVALSFLSSTAQKRLLAVMRRESLVAVNRSQAEELKIMRSELDGADAEDAEQIIRRIFGIGRARQVKPQIWKFETDYPARIVTKYRNDTELQGLIAETIRKYIDDKERSAK